MKINKQASVTFRSDGSDPPCYKIERIDHAVTVSFYDDTGVKKKDRVVRVGDTLTEAQASLVAIGNKVTTLAK